MYEPGVKVDTLKIKLTIMFYSKNTAEKLVDKNQNHMACLYLMR